MKKYVRKLFAKLDWKSLPELARWVIEEAIQIQQIPAPTFDEARRAVYVAEQFHALGLEEIRQDDLHNVYGRLRGMHSGGAGLMLVAHTDTVFSADTNLTIKKKDDLIFGPGLGDNSLGVSALLGMARFLREQAIQPDCDLWFVATTCEEGLGNLRGMRAAFEALRGQIAAVINLEGLAFGHIYHAGIAVHRLHIQAFADGGHSWLHFGRPSAIHGIVRLGARITEIHPPNAPRTTYNIGMIDGGQAINAIATRASLWLDVRSESRETLDTIVARVHNLIKEFETPELRFSVDVVGDRPAGFVVPDHPLVLGALTALEELDVRGVLETGSTDGNVSLAAGWPTVTIGITRGGNAHRLDEYIEVAPVELGLRQFIGLTLSAAQYLAEGNSV